MTTRNVFAAAIIVSLCTGFGLAHAHTTAQGHQKHVAGRFAMPLPQNNYRDALVIPALESSSGGTLSMKSESSPLSPDVKFPLAPAHISHVAPTITHNSRIIHENDADHMARLMSAPIVCAPATDNWVGGRSAECLPYVSR